MPHPIIVPSVSKLSGTWAPAASRALFLASAVSRSALAHAPAWPNWTSEVNILAHVPIHHAMIGLKNRPVLMASQRAYSSIPPTWRIGSYSSLILLRVKECIKIILDSMHIYIIYSACCTKLFGFGSYTCTVYMYRCMYMHQREAMRKPVLLKILEYVFLLLQEWLSFWLQGCHGNGAHGP